MPLSHNMAPFCLAMAFIWHPSVSACKVHTDSLQHIEVFYYIIQMKVGHCVKHEYKRNISCNVLYNSIGIFEL